MTRQERFQKAVMRGMKASPFASQGNTLIYLRHSGTRIELKGSLVSESTNSLEITQEGAMPEHVLDCHIDKTKLSFRPDDELDRLEFKGRVYKFTLESGDEDVSPVWCLEGRSPMN